MTQDINLMLIENNIRSIEEVLWALEQNVTAFNSKDNNLPIPQVNAKLIRKELNQLKAQVKARK